MNNITLIWKKDRKITDASYMFYQLKNITKIDLSNFDSSNIKDISHLFESCSSLTSINLEIFIQIQ